MKVGQSFSGVPRDSILMGTPTITETEIRQSIQVNTDSKSFETPVQLGFENPNTSKPEISLG